MTKNELVVAIADDLGVSRTVAARVVSSLLEKIQLAVAAGDSVKLSGFGTFDALQICGRRGRNPKTGECIDIPASLRPRFTAGDPFRRLLQEFE